jgi:hypothetical protein
MAIVAVCSAGLLVLRSPTAMIVFFTIFAGAVFICLSLGRHGFKFADITTLLVIILLTAAIVLPAMWRTGNRTLGKSLFPFIKLFSGPN